MRYERPAAIGAAGDLCPCVLQFNSCRSRRRGGNRHENHAAVAFEKTKPLTVTDVELDGPKAGEVLV